jgi:hypothetical protein
MDDREVTIPAVDYDDSPWTREELDALHWEMLKDEDWSEYDDPPWKP